MQMASNIQKNKYVTFHKLTRKFSDLYGKRFVLFFGRGYSGRNGEKINLGKKELTKYNALCVKAELLVPYIEYRT